MFGIGFWEMVVIGGLVLVAVGPDRLPTMLKQAARFYRQFRRTAEDVRASTGIDQMLRDEELKELAELRKQRLELMGPSGAKTAGKPAGPVVKPAPAKPAAPPDAGPIAGQGESVPVNKAALGPASDTLVRGLGVEAREREVPSMGVDLSEARLREPPPKAHENVLPEHVHPSKAALFAKTKAEA